MKNTEDVHRATEAVYKNLVENFNNGMQHILLTGKAYYKALQGVTATAHAYNDALSRVGTAARLCKGGTDEIGEGLLQIAEAQKEVQAQLEESTKSLYQELLLPLELKVEKEFKRASSDHRKYLQAHKATLSPYNKAYDSLKKFRKKTKNKFVYDNEKEAQYVNTLARCQRKLDEYRLNGLKIALLEERKCHCFLLQRLCATSSVNATGHQRGVDMYAPLPDWRQACANPTILPPAAQHLLTLDESYEQMNGGPYNHSNSEVLHRDNRDTQSMGSPFRRSASVHDVYRQSGHFDGSNTLPPRMTVPPPPTTSPQMKATYSFTASVESQLSFAEGDIISILGEKSEGWQYGQNTRTNRFGWFPLSFTQPLSSDMPPSPVFRPLSASQRFKSVGDLLDSRSLSEHSFMEHEVPGNIRRPKSLYEGPSFDNGPQVNPGSGVTSTSSSGYGSPARHQPGPATPAPPAPGMRQMPREDYGSEDDFNLNQNPMFSSVSLRQTKTNDRSAPKIK